MDIFMVFVGLFFIAFLLLGVSEGNQGYKVIAAMSFIICVSLIIYTCIVNRVITDTYINTDTTIIYGQNIKFSKSMKIKISRSHIPYCSGMLDKTEYYIGE